MAPNFFHTMLLLLPLLGPAIVMRSAPDLTKPFQDILLISIGAFAMTVWLIPIVANYTLKKGMYGMDINKRGTPGGEVKIPESLGIACGIVYLTAGAVGQFWYATDHTKVENLHFSVFLSESI